MAKSKNKSAPGKKTTPKKTARSAVPAAAVSFSSGTFPPIVYGVVTGTGSAEDPLITVVYALFQLDDGESIAGSGVTLEEVPPSMSLPATPMSLVQTYPAGATSGRRQFLYNLDISPNYPSGASGLTFRARADIMYTKQGEGTV